MHLSLDGRTLSVVQLGPDFLFLDAPINHPPTNGILFFAIDGHEQEREVWLPEGISAASPRVVIAKAA